MADPAAMNTMLNSTLAANSGGGGESHASPLTWIMSFGNAGGANIWAPAQHFAGKMGLAAGFGWLASSLGMQNMVGGNKLDKSPMGKPFSKKAKKMSTYGGNPFGSSPALSAPSVGAPQAPGGRGMD